MGVYLSEPITEKTVKEGTGKGFTFCMAEMQGKQPLIKVGEKIWKMPPSMKLNLETVTPFSLSLTGMEVLPDPYRTLSQQVCLEQIS